MGGKEVGREEERKRGREEERKRGRKETQISPPLPYLILLSSALIYLQSAATTCKRAPRGCPGTHLSLRVATATVEFFSRGVFADGGEDGVGKNVEEL